jgi:sulfoacetaldehyde dehydrogenase
VRIGAPKNIVQSLPERLAKRDTNELSNLVDLIVATGSQNNIQRALQSGTPTLGVGVGNVPSIIDESANLNDASHKIMTSKTFDNATSCSSENSIIVHEKVYDSLISHLLEEGGSLLNGDEKLKLQGTMWNDRGAINRDVIAKRAAEIAKLSGLSGKHLDSKFLMVEEQYIGSNYPFSMEKLSPVLTVYKAKDFDHAVNIAKDILNNQGKGHSCSNTLSTIFISQAAGKKSTDGTPKQHTCYVETSSCAIGIKCTLQSIHSAVDDAAIEAE